MPPPTAQLVKDINPGVAPSSTFTLGLAAGSLYFFLADNGTNGYELWKSDGTDAGTVPVQDILPGAVGSAPRALTNVNGTLFFTADNGTNGRELWKYN